MMRAPRQHGPTPTGEEWAWLTAAPDMNPFLGYSDTRRLTSWERLQHFWDARESEIRQAWGDTPPPLPYGHPALHGGRVGCPVAWSRRERSG